MVSTSERGEVAGKGGRRENTVQKTCTHPCKAKMKPVETTHERGVVEGRIQV
jgi:hypothetical protein